VTELVVEMVQYCVIDWTADSLQMAIFGDAAFLWETDLPLLDNYHMPAIDWI